MPAKKSKTTKLEFKNSVKEKLRRGESVIGATISVNNVEVAAQCAALGFDFIWLEMEHAPLSLEMVRHTVLATRGLPAVPFARPPTNELWTAKRVLDAGVLGVIFPFTRTPELARQAVAACRYPTRARPRCEPGAIPLARAAGILRFRGRERAGGWPSWKNWVTGTGGNHRRHARH